MRTSVVLSFIQVLGSIMNYFRETQSAPPVGLLALDRVTPKSNARFQIFFGMGRCNIWAFLSLFSGVVDAFAAVKLVGQNHARGFSSGVTLKSTPGRGVSSIGVQTRRVSSAVQEGVESAMAEGFVVSHSGEVLVADVSEYQKPTFASLLVACEVRRHLN